MYPLELFPGPTIPLSRLWRSDDGDDGDDDDDDDDDSTNGDDAEMQVVEQLPVVKQEDLEDNESRKSSMASTQVPMNKKRDAYVAIYVDVYLCK